ncbi:unnamed protein product [Brachionus calyciflorus]|uniref:Group XV phospholipase A2 n=1 Tax=Brachionus calyciflorus TaxID=104777 RepID=A0A813MIC6_9BILA|nr:unnamed protein product [Brachionus calyciflorus]
MIPKIFLKLILLCFLNGLNHARTYQERVNLYEQLYNIEKEVNFDRVFDKVKDKTLTKYPVVLVPGYGGNQLHARLNKTDAPHYFCQLKTSGFFELWLNLQEITPYVIDCFIDNIRLEYNNETKTTKNRDGVETKVNDFGGTTTVEYLDESKYSVTIYFGAIVDALVKKLNYTRGVNVRGAPYDWRKSPNELTDYYKNFTKLIEETYEMNNNTKVMLVAHSMGNPVSLYWLNNFVSQAWKDKYLKNFVSLSAPWGGASKTMRLMASGDNIDIIVVKPISVRSYQRSAPSTAFLMPNDRFWTRDDILVTTPFRNYTVYDYEDFFNDIGYPLGNEMRKNTERLIYHFEPPNVESHFLYGTGLKTPESFTYLKPKDFPDSQPAVTYGDGDGTVNLKSLQGFKKWIGQTKYGIYNQEIPGAEHVATLKHPTTIEYIIQLMYN